jgi:hypothetical protein
MSWAVTKRLSTAAKCPKVGHVAPRAPQECSKRRARSDAPYLNPVHGRQPGRAPEDGKLAFGLDVRTLIS